MTLYIFWWLMGYFLQINAKLIKTNKRPKLLSFIIVLHRCSNNTNCGLIQVIYVFSESFIIYHVSDWVWMANSPKMAQMGVNHPNRPLWKSQKEWGVAQWNSIKYNHEIFHSWQANIMKMHFILTYLIIFYNFVVAHPVTS